MKNNPGLGIKNLKAKSRGAAIMLALWALFLLAAMVISWALDIGSRFTLSANANRRLEAVAMACSGAEIALNPAVKAGSPNLHRQIGGRRSYEAHITGEGGRLNINGLVVSAASNNVTSCEQDTKLNVLCQYLTNKDIELNDLSVMIDSLLDWVSPGGGIHRLNAPPENETYHPAHTLLARLDELKKVKGWEEFTSNPGWDEDFTVNTNMTDPIDITSASRDVLLALPGMTASLVDHFLELRRGPDGIDGTEDDMRFTNLPQVQAALGLSPDQFRLLITPSSSTGASATPGVATGQPLIGFQSQVFRVVSVGKSSEAQRTVRLVFRKTGGAPQVITWKEY